MAEASDASQDFLTVLELHLRDLLTVAEAHFQRRIVVFAGESDWAKQCLQQLPDTKDDNAKLWVGDDPISAWQTISSSSATQVIGQTFQYVIYDCSAGIDLNALGVLAGTVSGGGLFILLIPKRWWCELSEVNQAQEAVLQTDPQTVPRTVQQRRTEQRILNGLYRHVETGVCSWIVQDEPFFPQHNHSQASLDVKACVERPQTTGSFQLTDDQQNAVAGIMRVAQGHRKRPLVILSDRGRGKSTSLGIAAKQLSGKNIIVTAPSRAIAESVFTAYKRDSKGSDLAATGGLQFIAPDALVRGDFQADLLLIDEAATLPVSMLATLLMRYSRVVFASTVHGYEGTGRGFALRFFKELDQLTPQWKQIILNTPLRWAADDPVEPLFFDLLLLNAQSASDVEIAQLSSSALRYQFVSAAALADNERLLRDVFSLLVLAHYRTTPNDLARMLDDPDVSVCVATAGEQQRVVATALLLHESVGNTALHGSIFSGERRIQGQILPQSLAAQANCREALNYTYWRVSRIAVHPAMQRQGVGSAMLGYIENEAAQRGFDFVGSSFSANEQVIQFWLNAKWRLVHLGVTRNKSTGDHAALVLKPLAKSVETLQQAIETRFYQSFIHELPGYFKDLSPALVSLIIGSAAAQAMAEQLTLEEHEKEAIAVFLAGHRPYEFCSLALWKCVLAGLNHPEISAQLASQQQQLVVARVLQQKDWPTVVAMTELSGKKAVLQALRDAIRLMLAGFSAVKTEE